MARFLLVLLGYSLVVPSVAFRASVVSRRTVRGADVSLGAASRRSFLVTNAAAAAAVSGWGLWTAPAAQAVGPVKITLEALSYQARPCPPDKPIPGQMAMKGMRGLCVTVEAKLKDAAPKDLEKVGVYGFITDASTGNSVLANNPDLSTDAGQFAMVESVTPKDKKILFEFVAAVPSDKDLSQYEDGIGPLDFESLRIISYPGGQQYGAINPCEMNEFSEECEVWEQENGSYQKAEFMVKSNPRTKGG
ncbi:predicted protein [Phaeodactylum tricornutum CCAP 1055/1]|jgi:hypothetical protein|uniref:Uncharacterized protein n=1 Tax=Phaeodactylum tricornutum (strain CCAP 1055/1) TaxID=556484 RepID=B7FXB4_PHATC|nr:predicted protein [Phaeodactylum tricornutum CCAP 1055/1]EEC49132.1 predicted protein [Phaeodactylum tricornutum CCAP 1055/1]|eukprot:XP_002179309.1 predicted protein [Phaeodactylum tricornutum CCAP 1055/1]